MKILKLENVNKNIKGKKILDNVSFEINEGSINGLVGGNGSGKTTLMKVILGLANYQSGVLQKNNNTKENCIGALIENPGVYPFLTGYENMKLFDETNGDNNIKEIIDKLEMSNFIYNKAKTYSLGMKQKLGIALALLNHPQLVILDEPMNGLDPKSVKNVRDTILDFKKRGVTFLISSHILSELVKITDSVLIIDEGKIIRETSIEDLKKGDGDNLETILIGIINKEDLN